MKPSELILLTEDAVFRAEIENLSDYTLEFLLKRLERLTKISDSLFYADLMKKKYRQDVDKKIDEYATHILCISAAIYLHMVNSRI